MARFYYLGPWVLDHGASPKGGEAAPFWRAPDGTVGLIDLRALDGSGVGFFATDREIANSDYEPFGDTAGSHLSAITMDVSKRAAWASLLGIDVTVVPGSLLDILWHTLTIYSDPDGAVRAKPIIPTARGAIELHLGGHSLVKSSRMPKNAVLVPHWGQIQRVIQNDYREVVKTAERGQTPKARDLHRRWLGSQQAKYGLTEDAASALLIPDGMEKVRPLKPETTITDDFNRANADPPSNAAAGWSWTEVSGTFWAIDTNLLKYPNQNTSVRSLRAESDLSGTDHSAQIDSTVHDYDDSTLTEQGAAARFDSAAETMYLGGQYRTSTGGSGGGRIAKVVTGTRTDLGSNTMSYTLPNTIVLTVDGSSLDLTIAGSSVVSLTDSSITTGTRTGVTVRYQLSTNRMDNFSATDLAAGGVFTPYYYREHIARAG